MTAWFDFNVSWDINYIVELPETRKHVTSITVGESASATGLGQNSVLLRWVFFKKARSHSCLLSIELLNFHFCSLCY